MTLYRWFSCVVAFVLLSACMPISPSSSSPSDSAKVTTESTSPTTDTMDVFAVNRALGRGVNLGNALEAPNFEGEWGLLLEERFFDLIAEAGFDSVRVPIRWSTHADAQSPYTIETALFERVDWVIEQALRNDLAVVINIHHYEEMISNPDGQLERFLALWAQIAERYKDQPATLVFELLNEPNGNLTSTKWNKILKEGIKTIRQSNPTRAIVVGPSHWNNINFLSSMTLPKDPNLILTFHYYDPFQFTHQGAEWVDGSNAWLGTSWGNGAYDEQAIASSFKNAANWAKKQNRPLFMGEFGAYEKADMKSRQLWTTAVTKIAVGHDISIAYWEFGAGFGVYNRAKDEWNEGLRAALLDTAR